jgi:hypothetical protein
MVAVNKGPGIQFPPTDQVAENVRRWKGGQRQFVA